LGTAPRKGIGLIFPNWYTAEDGNVNEASDVGGGPGKSFLFFLTGYHPGIGLSGDRVTRLGKHRNSAVSGALSTAREKLAERISCVSSRTH